MHSNYPSLTQIDTSYISQNHNSQFGPIEFSSTPRKPVLRANSSHERRRSTICCYSCHLADSFPANVGRFNSLTSEVINASVFLLGRRPNVACKYVFQFFLIQRYLQISFTRKRPCPLYFHWRQDSGSKCILLNKIASFRTFEPATRPSYSIFILG
jgi:hypothetical protein